MPKSLSGDNKFGLPPYAKRMSFLVDDFPACPENWMRSEDKLKSYFVAVKEGMGMWLDFNGCADHEHDVAIVISIQGINPITGLPCNDPQLEQYVDKCPKHDKKFEENRHCCECGFDWPKQNYITTTATPNGKLWIDGFKSAEGVVRQYILTEEKMKGVASNVIGKDRVYAIGLSFFISKATRRVRLDKEMKRLEKIKAKEEKIKAKETRILEKIQKETRDKYDCQSMGICVLDCFDIKSENISQGAWKKWTPDTKFKIKDNRILEEDSDGQTINELTGGNYRLHQIVNPSDLNTKGHIEDTNSGGLIYASKFENINSPDLIMGDWNSGDVVNGQPQFFSPIHTPVDWGATSSNCFLSSAVNNEGVTLDSMDLTDDNSRGLGTLRSASKVSLRKKSVKAGKKLEVGAGAKISQDIYEDPYGLDYWKDEPESILCLNYCTESVAKEIIEANSDVIVKLNKKDGFLQDVPVGN
jgi:hypothetical protein